MADCSVGMSETMTEILPDDDLDELSMSELLGRYAEAVSGFDATETLKAFSYGAAALGSLGDAVEAVEKEAECRDDAAERLDSVLSTLADVFAPDALRPTPDEAQARALQDQVARLKAAKKDYEALFSDASPAPLAKVLAHAAKKPNEESKEKADERKALAAETKAVQAEIEKLRLELTKAAPTAPLHDKENVIPIEAKVQSKSVLARSALLRELCGSWDSVSVSARGVELLSGSLRLGLGLSPCGSTVESVEREGGAELGEWEAVVKERLPLPLPSVLFSAAACRRSQLADTIRELRRTYRGLDWDPTRRELSVEGREGRKRLHIDETYPAPGSIRCVGDEEREVDFGECLESWLLHLSAGLNLSAVSAVSSQNDTNASLG